MLPGYITLFRDNDNYVHLFFYKGLTNENTFYYNDLDLTSLQRSGYVYKIINHDKYSQEYIFENKNIKSMTCNLMSFNGKHIKQTLKIK